MQLTDASTEAVLWTKMLDALWSDYMGLEDALSDGVAAELRDVLSDAERQALPRYSTISPEARRLCMEGRYHVGRGYARATMRAIDCFERAIVLDPNYALAHASLAEARTLLGFISGGASPAEEFRAARHAATRALEIDPLLAEAHTCLAFVSFHFDWDWSEAEREFSRAIALKPSHAAAREGFGSYLLAMGRLEEARAELRRALDIDPLSFSIMMHLGLTLYAGGELDAALGMYRTILDLEPGFAGAHALMGWVFEEQGLYREALSALRKASELDPEPGFRQANLARTHALEGQTKEAARLLHDVVRAAEQRFLSPTAMAEAYEALGDTDRALEWLSRAYDEHDSHLAYLMVNHRLARLRTDDRFTALCRRMNFPAPVLSRSGTAVRPARPR